MKAGLEFDALVAEKLMGWAPNYPKGWPHPPKDAPDRKKYFDHEGVTVIPSYSTDIAAAWEVVKQLTEDGKMAFNLDFEIYTVSWVARFVDKNGVTFATPLESGQSVATSPSFAICLAALKAAGVEA